MAPKQTSDPIQLTRRAANAFLTTRFDLIQPFFPSLVGSAWWGFGSSPWRTNLQMFGEESPEGYRMLAGSRLVAEGKSHAVVEWLVDMPRASPNPEIIACFVAILRARSILLLEDFQDGTGAYEAVFRPDLSGHEILEESQAIERDFQGRFHIA